MALEPEGSLVWAVNSHLHFHILGCDTRSGSRLSAPSERRPLHGLQHASIVGQEGHIQASLTVRRLRTLVMSSTTIRRIRVQARKAAWQAPSSGVPGTQ